MIHKPLTKLEAIQKSIKLWTWLAETGLKKEDYDWASEGTVFVEPDDGEMYPFSSCWLCEYSEAPKFNYYCDACPYCAVYGECIEGVYHLWTNAETSIDKRKYARAFLRQLKTLEKEALKEAVK